MNLEIGFFGRETAGELSHKVPPHPLKTFWIWGWLVVLRMVEGVASRFLGYARNDIGDYDRDDIGGCARGVIWGIARGVIWEAAGGVTGVGGCGIVVAVFRFSDGGVQS